MEWWPMRRAQRRNNTEAGAPIARRAALTAALGGCCALIPGLAPAQVPPEGVRARPQAGDLLVKVVGEERRPLTLDDVPLVEKQIIAWPFDAAADLVRSGSRLNKVLLLRLDPAGFDAETREHASDGVVAYSAICPHTGCEVSNWQAEPQLLECPCHYSHYDPKAGAKVLSGPSPRRLAALPLTSADGRLVVAKPFIGRVGFQQS
jgi:rieske iron-sulfur protein